MLHARSLSASGRSRARPSGPEKLPRGFLEASAGKQRGESPAVTPNKTFNISVPQFLRNCRSFVGPLKSVEGLRISSSTNFLDTVLDV